MRLVLLAHGGTAATRAASFPDDEALDAQGREGAAGLAGRLRRVDEVVVAPSLRCRETAGLAVPTGPAPTDAEELAGPDPGRWAGRDLADVAGADPAGLRAWLSDPDTRPPGGESTAELTARVGRWMDRRSSGDAVVVLAVVDPPVVRAALVHALRSGPEALWRVDVAPLTLATLTSDGTRWNLRALGPAHPSPDDALAPDR